MVLRPDILSILQFDSHPNQSSIALHSSILFFAASRPFFAINLPYITAGSFL
jgi:hypothetical protein